MKKIYILLLVSASTVPLRAQHTSGFQGAHMMTPNGVNPIVYFIDTSVSVSEGSTTFLFQVGIINPNSAPTSVNVKIVGGTATQGVDYTLDSIQTITFAGDSSSPISSVGNIIPDIIPEPNETILLMLLNPTNGGSIVNDTLRITITDNDEVGLENISLFGVRVFPAISSGIFNVSTDLNSTVTVKDIFGNMVWQKNDAAGKFQLDLQNLAKGIYFITVENTQGKLSKKVVIQ